MLEVESQCQHLAAKLSVSVRKTALAWFFVRCFGWICVQGGQPGQWVNITTPLAVGGTTTSITTLEEGAPQNGEIAAMRKELALLRAAVKDLQLDHQRPIN